MRKEDKRLQGINRLVSKRFCNHPVLGTFADIFYKNEFVCVSVEQPNRNNQRFVSCVPAGVYELVPYSSDKYPDTYALQNPMLNVFADFNEGERQAKQGLVNEAFRFACVLHKANWAEELQGCIGPGAALSSGKKKGSDWPSARWMVTDSKNTTKNLKQLIEDEGITHIEIQDVSNEIIDEGLYYGEV